MKVLKRAILLSAAFSQSSFTQMNHETNTVNASRFLNLIFSEWGTGEVTYGWKKYCNLYLIGEYK